MVNNVIEMMNTLAKEKHEEEHRLSQEKEEEEARLNKPVFIPGQSSSREQKQREAQEARIAAVPKKFEVPPCDLFEVASLPELCSHGSICFSEEGCYLAKIQRKEIISLDAKYMIKIAEARGLFGTEPAKKKVVAARAPKKQERRRVSSAKIKVKRAKLEIERITAPTQSTISRKKETSPLYIPSPPCPRHQSHTSDIMNKVIQAKRTMIRQWWRETYNVILKQIPYNRLTPRSKAVANVPKLRLSRSKKRKPFPMHKTMIEFEASSESGILEQIMSASGLVRRNSC